MTKSALEDLRVLDLSTRLSGAYAAKLLGDNGADVVLLEGAGGHPARSEAPFLDDEPGVERSLVHAYVNANKRSVRSASAAVTDELIRAADIVVVSDAETARRASEVGGERTVVAAVTPYGLESTMAAAPGNDLTTAAVAGWALVNGDEGGPPLRPTLHQSEYLAGVVAYSGAVAAVFERDRHGIGQTVDVCELEPMLWMAAPSILATAQGDGPARGRGRPGVFSGPVPTSDGHFSVTFSRPHFWTEAMKALGLNDLAEDPRYLNRLVRQQEAATLEPRIEGAIAARGRWELFDALSKERATVGIVLDMADIATSEHLASRGIFGETSIDGRSVRTLSSPCVMSETPWQQRRPAPVLGADTEAVLAEWGIGAQEVAS